MGKLPTVFKAKKTDAIPWADSKYWVMRGAGSDSEEGSAWEGAAQGEEGIPALHVCVRNEPVPRQGRDGRAAESSLLVRWELIYPSVDLARAASLTWWKWKPDESGLEMNDEWSRRKGSTSRWLSGDMALKEERVIVTGEKVGPGKACEFIFKI